MSGHSFELDHKALYGFGSTLNTGRLATEGTSGLRKFSGNFYEPATNATRGLTLGQHFPQIPDEFKMPSFAAESEKSYTAISASQYPTQKAHPALSQGVKGFPPVAGLEQSSLYSLFSNTCLDACKEVNKVKESASASWKQAAFTDANGPPALPQDKFFKLNITTLHVSSNGPPHEIANIVLEFLRTGAAGLLLKISQPKYAVKVNVVKDDVLCTLKVRVYKEGPGKYAVEFQRRSGDCVVFCKTYEEATKYVSRNYKVEM